MQSSVGTTDSFTQLFREDVVLHTSTGELCLIMRSWRDDGDIPFPSSLFQDPTMRSLERGELNVMELNSTKRTIIMENECELVERYYHIGDPVKRANDGGSMSGIVIAHTSELRLQHVITNASTSTEWIPEMDVVLATETHIGDLVVFDDWLGHVEEIFEDVAGDINGKPVELEDIGGHYRLGRSKEYLRSAHPESPFLDIVYSIRPVVLCIAWLALNQSLPPEVAAERARPQRFWHGPEVATLTIMRRSGDNLPHVVDRVEFRNEELANLYGAPKTEHAGFSRPITVKALKVVATRTQVTVLWQDGTTNSLPSESLIPHQNIDELECWPGDFVICKGDGPHRLAVVQSVNPSHRTVEVLWYPPSPGGNAKSVVSALEIDPHGPVVNEGYEVFGVQRGDIVFVHPPATNNGLKPPGVPKIGELEQWVRHPAHQEWRQKFVTLGVTYARISILGMPKVGAAPDTTVDWVGEVIDLRLNGDVVIRLPSGRHIEVAIDHVTILNDFAEDLEAVDDAVSDTYDDYEMMDIDGAQGHHQATPTRVLAEDPSVIREMDDWEHLADENYGSSSYGNEILNSSALLSSPTRSSSSQGSPPPPLNPSIFQLLPNGKTPNPAEESPWQPFMVLPSAPSDHAFFSQVTAGRPNRAFVQRLRKEYRVLSSSLPDNIIVRAFEDRTDLLRSMIIGSEDTPYEDAPFVIDWFLPPAFPNEPPKAHFHSWTNGNGRVNPNLYEEGKVCLSILNTWEGDKIESWSAARSSILQGALVSIQGLVLVQEPYFCEPSFERMRGTQEGSLSSHRRSSQMYNERAYVLARSFVRHAVLHPPSTLQDEIRWLYFTRSRLQKVVLNAQNLINYSSDSELGLNPTNHHGGVARLTQGAMLPLSRTLGQLNSILAGPSAQHV